MTTKVQPFDSFWSRGLDIFNLLKIDKYALANELKALGGLNGSLYVKSPVLKDKIYMSYKWVEAGEIIAPDMETTKAGYIFSISLSENLLVVPAEETA
jgi:hypothetical protein